MKAVIGLILALCLGGCCPQYHDPGHMRVCGSAIGENGTVEQPDWLMLFDESIRCFVWVDRASWEAATKKKHEENNKCR